MEIVATLLADPKLLADARLNVTVGAICKQLGIACKTYYRWRNDPEGEDKRATCKRAPSPRRLSPAEQSVIVEKFNAPEVAGKSITEAIYYYLDRGEYYGSESTVRRVLRTVGVEQSTPRDGTRKCRQPSDRPAKYVAKGPNEVWTWATTTLRGHQEGEQYFVYVAVDVYSRMITGYGVFDADNADNAITFLSETLDKHGIQPNQLVLHSNNGAAMMAVDTLAMLKARGVAVSQSKPRKSPDNMFSESLFATLKNRMGLDSRRYASIEECAEAVGKAVERYNTEHHHHGINFVTPAERHAGSDSETLAKRKATLERARALHPNRWIKGRVMNCKPAGPQNTTTSKSEERK